MKEWKQKANESQVDIFPYLFSLLLLRFFYKTKLENKQPEMKPLQIISVVCDFEDPNKIKSEWRGKIKL